MKHLTSLRMPWLLFLLVIKSGLFAQSVVSWDPAWSGRFGDRLMIYARAKWMAHKYKLPFFYHPFPYSDQLILHETQMQPPHDWRPRRMIRVMTQHDISSSAPDTLFQLDFFFRDTHWENWEEVSTWKDMLADEEFITQLKAEVRPKSGMSRIDLPADCVSVAVHMRKGGGYDLPLLYEHKKAGIPLHANRWEHYCDVRYPYKFLPDEFYAQQIDYVAQLFKDKKILVFLFTDHQNPRELAERLQGMISARNVAFACRTEGNAHDRNVLIDFFSLTQCDCLIKSGSSFCQAADLVGDQKMTIYPRKVHWQGDDLIVDEVGIWIKDPSFVSAQSTAE